jgi:hypothetical protein
VVLGVLAWGGALAHWLHPIPEPLASSVGALAIAGGIFWNARLRHQVTCAACEVHSGSTTVGERVW